MPWKNQGGGPWGSGPKGPWGSGSATGRPKAARSRRSAAPRSGPAAAAVARRIFQRHGHRAAVDRRIGDLGPVRVFRVQSEELGVVLRFGKHVRTVQPGLNYHLPYPIETVLLPKALRVSTLSIGMTLIDDPARRGRTMRDVPEESLMLTGDENIVDVDFTVLWRIKPDGVGNYLFNIRIPKAP